MKRFHSPLKYFSFYPFLSFWHPYVRIHTLKQFNTGINVPESAWKNVDVDFSTFLSFSPSFYSFFSFIMICFISINVFHVLQFLIWWRAERKKKRRNTYNTSAVNTLKTTLIHFPVRLVIILPFKREKSTKSKRRYE